MPFLIVEADDRAQMSMDRNVIEWMAIDLILSEVDLSKKCECTKVLIAKRYPIGAVQRLVFIASATALRQRSLK